MLLRVGRPTSDMMDTSPPLLSERPGLACGHADSNQAGLVRWSLLLFLPLAECLPHLIILYVSRVLLCFLCLSNSHVPIVGHKHGQVNKLFHLMVSSIHQEITASLCV